MPVQCRPLVSDAVGAEAWAIAAQLESAGFSGHSVRTGLLGASRVQKRDPARAPPPVCRLEDVRPMSPGNSALILAAETDAGAADITDRFEEAGVPIARCDLSDTRTSFSVQVTRTGAPTVHIHRGDGMPVGAIVNRGGFELPCDASPEARYAAYERLAAWWAALALFPGPVINRPTRYGFMPVLDALDLAKRIDGVCVASHWTELAQASDSVPAPTNPAPRGTNIHRMHSGEWVHPDDWSSESGSMVVCVTRFDPEAVFRLVVVGRDCHTDDLRLAARHADVVRRLRDHLGPRMLLCSLVLESTQTKATILAVDGWPVPSRFRQLSVDITGSVLRYVAGAEPR